MPYFLPLARVLRIARRHPAPGGRGTSGSRGFVLSSVRSPRCPVRTGARYRPPPRRRGKDDLLESDGFCPEPERKLPRGEGPVLLLAALPALPADRTDRVVGRTGFVKVWLLRRQSRGGTPRYRSIRSSGSAAELHRRAEANEAWTALDDGLGNEQSKPWATISELRSAAVPCKLHRETSPVSLCKYLPVADPCNHVPASLCCSGGHKN
mmetsp:Transcript_13150/g.31318  ORF Transcript_13150/g.31318 Transcript_13150/m.31318 type:complete len:209 (+) Transcript_13150:927-1553(+)